MIARDKAIKQLNEYWGTNQWVFQADFHIPKNITLREGTNPFGYFRNIRFNGEILEYPLENLSTQDRRISVYQVLRDGLLDRETYEVTFDLAKEEHRKKNPYQLIVKYFKKINKESADSDSSLRKTITDIFNENININTPFQVVNLANSVESLATDIYSEDKRFIYELIQNADDAALDEDSEISIQILDNYVIISHNGTPFNSRDIRGLCSIGIGTKTNDATKTGYKGIGFKSVFGQPDGIVYVKSENTLFRFDREYSRQRGWNERWGNKLDWEEKNGVTFQSPWQMMPILTDRVNDVLVDKLLNRSNYTVKTAIKIQDGEKIYNNVKNFFGDAKFMLFLRRIKCVQLTYKENKIQLKKSGNVNHTEIVNLIRNNESLSSWYVKNWVHNIPLEIQNELRADPKTPRKIQSMEKTEISFALEINESFNQIKLLNEGDSPLYSYLPTMEKEYNIPFIVNCNFLLDASREKIHKNRKWNEWLFQVIGYKTVECCSEFLEKNLFPETYLSIFRNGFYNELDNLRQCLNNGIKIGLDKFPVLKNNNNIPCKLYDIALDPYSLNRIDDNIPVAVSMFVNEIRKNELLNADSLIPLNDYNKILIHLHPLIIKELLLQKFFASKYVNQILNTKNNYKVLCLLYPLENNDPSGEWYTIVTQNKLIINEYGELDYIPRVCFPVELNINDDNQYKNTLINNEVYKSVQNDLEIKKWLEKIGVTEPSSIAYLEKEIIGNIQNCIDDNNYLDITRFIFRLYKDNRLNETHYLHLQELPLKTNKGFCKANMSALSTNYHPTIDLKQTLKDESFISDDYLEISSPIEVKRFFKTLGARDDIEFIKKIKKYSLDLPSNYVEFCYQTAKEGHSYPNLIGKFYPNTPPTYIPFYIQYITFLEKTNNLTFAKVFWERVFNKYLIYKDREAYAPDRYSKDKEYIIYNIGIDDELSTLDEMAWGRLPNNKVAIPSYILWFFNNTKCIPTNLGLKMPSESFINSDKNIELGGNYVPIIDIKLPVPQSWCQIVEFKNELSIEDLLTILNEISRQTNKKGFLDKENEKRLGLIYNEFIIKLKYDYNNTFNKIQRWAENASLISSSKKSISTKQLLFINIQGFENKNIGIETIYIPNNVDRKLSVLLDLLKVLNIRIIDDFNYSTEIAYEIKDIKIKLLNLIGPICLLLKNKMLIQDVDKAIYERFSKISNTNFFFCKSIYPVFKYEKETIKGDLLNYFHDKNKNKFLLSIKWSDPLSILELSHEISLLLSATKIEKEIMMLLSLSNAQIEQLLLNNKLDPKEYTSSNSYTDIKKLINLLENEINIKQNETQEDNIKSESGKENNEKGKSTETKIEEKESLFSETEIAMLKGIFGRDLEPNELMEENLFAQVKALRYFKDKKFNIEEAEKQFKNNYKDKFINPVIDENGNSYKVMCRSARKGILFLGAYAWQNLSDANSQLFILTGDKSTDNIIFNTQVDLEETFKTFYKVIRRVNTTVEDVQALVASEKNLKDMQFLYQVKKGSFDIIFNPKQNKPGETGGALTDIGKDDI